MVARSLTPPTSAVCGLPTAVSKHEVKLICHRENPKPPHTHTQTKQARILHMLCTLVVSHRAPLYHPFSLLSLIRHNWAVTVMRTGWKWEVILQRLIRVHYRKEEAHLGVCRQQPEFWSFALHYSPMPAFLWEIQWSHHYILESYRIQCPHCSQKMPHKDDELCP